MKFVLDNCVISELRHASPDKRVQSLIQSLPDDVLYVSVLTVGEIAKGVALLPHGRKKAALGLWVTQLQADFADRILLIDAQTTEIWGRMTATAVKNGFALPPIDGLIAASASRHGMTVLTRNKTDFAPSRVPVLDPWTEGLG